MYSSRNALRLVEEYATKWGVCLPGSPSVKCARRWLLIPIEYRIQFDSEACNVIAYCERSKPKPTAFMILPQSDEFIMLPPWAAFPFYSAFTIGWRMGDGEWYLHEWFQWYDKPGPEDKMDYRNRFAVPEDERGWHLNFWDDFDTGETTDL